VTERRSQELYPCASLDFNADFKKHHCDGRVRMPIEEGAVSGSGNASQCGAERLLPLVACTLGSESRVLAERRRRLRDEAGLACSETERGLRPSFRVEPAVEEDLRGSVADESERCACARWDRS
jgi:hypothetical protein